MVEHRALSNWCGALVLKNMLLNSTMSSARYVMLKWRAATQVMIAVLYAPPPASNIHLPEQFCLGLESSDGECNVEMGQVNAVANSSSYEWFHPTNVPIESEAESYWFRHVGQRNSPVKMFDGVLK